MHSEAQREIELKLAATVGLLAKMRKLGPKAFKLDEPGFSQAEANLMDRKAKLQAALDTIAGAWDDFAAKAGALSKPEAVERAYGRVFNIASDPEVKAALKREL